ncbi:MAG: thiol-activated cytolysin family protein [Acetivibrio ethanolgignens]
MGKKFFRIVSSALLAISLLSMTQTQILAETGNDIDEFIYGLEYNNQDVLTQTGETLTNVPVTSGNTQNGKYIVVQREKKSISNNSADISVIDFNGSSIYAGAILKADKGLVDNSPTIVAVPRGELTLSIDLPGMENNDSYIKVESPAKSSVDSAINNLLAKWNKTYASDYANIPAKLQYNETMVYSKSQLKTKFGASFEKLIVPLNINFEAVHSGEKQIQIVNFKQIYYTVSVDTPNYPHEFFKESVTAEQLRKKGLNSSTPPVYVSNVSYGRSMYIKLETDSKSTQVQGAFDAVIKGADISNNTEYQDILKNTSFSAVIFGGDAGGASQVISGKIDDLKKIIQEGARYSRSNPGVPISYSTHFMRDNAPAAISSYSEYVQTTSTSYDNSFLTLDHSGGYVARFYVDWDELSYDKDGKEVWEHKSWHKNGWNLTSHWSETIEIPGNAHNLHIVIQECTGLAWEWWRTVYDKKNVPLVGKRKITIWGTTLYPQFCDETIK